MHPLSTTLKEAAQVIHAHTRFTIRRRRRSSRKHFVSLAWGRLGIGPHFRESNTTTLLLHFQNFVYFCFSERQPPKDGGRRGWESKNEKEKMENGSRLRLAEPARVDGVIRSEGCGLVLRSPRDTEPDIVVGAVRVAGAALRRAAISGEEAPAAAAGQTVRTSRRSCGVGHAC